MSGEITVTPGQTFTNEDVTPTRLNNLGAPTMVVAANAITTREIRDLQDIVDAAGSDGVLRNWFANPHFDGDLTEATSAVTCSSGADTQVTPNWFTRPAGAAMTTQWSGFTLASGEDSAAMDLTGDTSVTTVDFGQYLPPYLCAMLADLGNCTVSIHIQNETAATLTPALRIDTSDTEGDRVNVTNQVDQNLTSISDSATGKRSYTVDFSSLTNIRNGARLYWRMPSGALDADTKTVYIGAPQLEPGSSATDWNVYLPKGLSSRPVRRHALHKTADPGLTNDGTEGWTIGSVWRNRTTGDLFQCVDPAIDEARWVRLGVRDSYYAFYRDEEAQNTNAGQMSPGSRERDWVEIINSSGEYSLTVDEETLVLGPEGLFDIKVASSMYQTQTCYSEQTSARYRFPTLDINHRSPNSFSAASALETTITKRAGMIATGNYRFGTIPVSGEVTHISQLDIGTASATSDTGRAANFGTEVYGFLSVEFRAFAEQPNELPGVFAAAVRIDENIDITDFPSATIQGVTLTLSGLHYQAVVLLTGQDDPAENGLYFFGGAGSALNTQRGKRGVIAAVQGGTYAGKQYMEVLNVTTLGTDDQKWVECRAPHLIPHRMTT